MKYTEAELSKLMEQLYSGEVTEHYLPEKLYQAISSNLESGLFKGFGNTMETAAGSDLQLLSELRNNVWMFGAAKTYQQVIDIRSNLFDAAGNLVNVQEFNKLGRATFDNWNNNWGRTEYETAIGQAQSASHWNEITKNQHLLPTLVFDTKGNPCDRCAPFEGFTAPVSDSIWDWLIPLLHFNCGCIVRQEDSDYELSSDDKYKEVNALKSKVPPLFQMNAGKDKIIFSKEHPYFQVASKDLNFAKANFNLPLPEMPVMDSGAVSAQEVEIKASPNDWLAFHQYNRSKDFINDYLEKGIIPDTIAKEKIIKTTVPKIDKMLKNAPKFQGVSYKAAGFKDLNEYQAFRNKYSTGETYFRQESYLTTTYDQQLALEKAASGQYTVMIHYEGVSGVSTDELLASGMERGKAIMFQRNKFFKLVREETIIGENGSRVTNVYMKELASEGSHKAFKYQGSDNFSAKKVKVSKFEKPLTVEQGKEKMEQMIIDKSFEPREIKGIQAYTGNSYREMNSYLRFGTTDSFETEHYLGAVKRNIEDTKSFLKKAPKVETESFRGISFDKQVDYHYFKSQVNDGAIFLDKGFMSTTTKQGIDKSFIKDDHSYRINFLVKGRSGVPLEPVSVAKREQEILFHPETKFIVRMVTETTTDKGATLLNIVIEEIK